MCSKSVIAALPVLLLVVGCGGGARTTTPPVAGRSNLARFDVDAATGRVTISQTSGRAAFEGGAVSFSSSDLIVVPGDAGQRVIRVKATNNSGQTWGSSPVRMVVSDLRNAGGNDVRIRVRVRTRAGSGSASESDGFGLSASFASPTGIALGAGPTAGSVFVADLNGPTLRRMLLDGMVSTVAGLAGSPGPDDGTGSSARFMGPHGVATDSSGNVYVADDYGQTIRRITPLGRVTTIAGSGVAGELDGGGATAKFASPSGIAATPDGNRIYVCDRTGATIRLIEYVGAGSRELASSYVVTTIAGSAYAAGWADGAGSAARFDMPYSVALHETGDTDVLIVAERGSCAIRRVEAQGAAPALVSTIAGHNGVGDADGPGSVARFAGPTGVCAMQREEGGLIALIADGNALRALSYRGGNEPRQAGNYEVVTLAGSAVAGYADGDGYVSRFNGARDVACVATEGDSTTAYVSDLFNCRIREVSIPSGDLHSGGAAGAPTETVRLITYDDEAPNQSAWRRSMAPVGNSYETELQFYVPRGVSGFSFYAWIETDTNVVNLPAQNASLLTTVAGNGVPGGLDGPGKMARLNDPRGVAAVPAALADRYRMASGAAIRAVFTDGHRVRMADTRGNVETLVGSGTPGFADGMGGSAAFHDPDGIAICPDGSLVVADSGNHRIRRVWPNGLVVTIAGSTAGSADGAGNVAAFNGPAGVAVTPGGVIFVADTSNHTIRRIMLVAGADPRQASAYRVITVAGQAGSSGLADGVGAAARFASPHQLVVRPDGDLYVADTDNARVRRLTDFSGTAMSVTTLAAAVNAPTGLALDAAGNLYVAESSPPLISRISTVGVRDALMGSAGTGFVDGPNGQMQSPWNLSLEASGTLLLTDRTNHALRSLQRVLDTAQGHYGAGGGER